MRIGDIMSRPAVVVRSDETLEEAARLMWECDCGVVPVVDEDDRVTGVVTDRDICMAAYTKGKTLRELRIAEAMSRQVFSCHEEDSVEGAERLMRDRQVRRLPVIDRAGRPVGVVSLGDVARFAVGESKWDGGEREVTDSLAEISRPRQRRIQAAGSRDRGMSLL